MIYILQLSFFVIILKFCCHIRHSSYQKTKAYKVGLEIYRVQKFYILSLVMQNSQNDLSFSLYAMLSIYYVVITTEDWKRSLKRNEYGYNVLLFFFLSQQFITQGMMAVHAYRRNYVWSINTLTFLCSYPTQKTTKELNP